VHRACDLCEHVAVGEWQLGVALRVLAPVAERIVESVHGFARRIGPAMHAERDRGGRAHERIFVGEERRGIGRGERGELDERASSAGA
jgi:hypothetical protein